MDKEFPEDSDSSDEDYVPAGAATGEVLSEVDSDGDPEDPLSDTEQDNVKPNRRKRATKKKVKQNEVTTETAVEESEKKELSAEEKKKHADDLWASFKMDTGFKKKDEIGTKSVSSSSAEKATDKTTEEKTNNKMPETVKITQIFEFAGEEVKIQKEVKADSAEARLSQAQTASNSSDPPSNGPPKRKAGLGGIGSVLSQIGKKQKLSTLEKTKLDWDSYKSSNKIESELDAYKKGKGAYLDRQDFLQRADERRFEIERNARNVERSKRWNNA